MIQGACGGVTSWSPASLLSWLSAEMKLDAPVLRTEYVA